MEHSNFFFFFFSIIKLLVLCLSDKVSHHHQHGQHQRRRHRCQRLPQRHRRPGRHRRETHDHEQKQRQQIRKGQRTSGRRSLHIGAFYCYFFLLSVFPFSTTSFSSKPRPWVASTGCESDTMGEAEAAVGFSIRSR